MKENPRNIDQPTNTNGIEPSIPIDGPIPKSPVIIGASIGNCVHIAGVANFLRIAESMGIKTILMGAAVSPTRLIETIDKINPSVSVSAID